MPLVPRIDTSSTTSTPTQLSLAALNSSLFHSPTEQIAEDVSSLAEETSVPPSTIAPPTIAEEDDDPNREARTRWIRIN
jgi:hypothetical protein